MTGAKPPRNPRLGALGRRLRETRIAAGYTSGNRFARERLPHWGQSKVSRVETGQITPTVLDIAQWARAVGASDELRDELEALHYRATTLSLRVEDAARFPGGLIGQIDEIAALEAGSSTVAEYQQVVIPAMGQTPAYGRAFLTQPDRPTVAGVADPDAVVSRRAARQREILGRAREAVVAVNEAALWAHHHAGTGVHRAALEHLASLHPRVELLVEPLAAMAASLGGFELLDDVVLLESIDGTRIVADPAVVARFRTALDAIRARSYRGDDAVALIRRYAAEHR